MNSNGLGEPKRGSLETKISVIVPIYNSEQFVPPLLEQLKAQTYDNWEVICIVDGSLDEGDKLLLEGVRQDPRLRVVCQPNGGVSQARNRGLERIKGELITFVDADDYIANDYLHHLCWIYEKTSHQTDIIVVGNQDLHKGDFPTPSSSRSDFQTYNQITGKLIPECKVSVVWAKGFRSDLLLGTNVRFNTDFIVAEDTLFILQLLSYARTIAIDNAYRGYGYRLPEGDSLSASCKKLYPLARILMLKLLLTTKQFDWRSPTAIAIYKLLLREANRAVFRYADSYGITQAFQLAKRAFPRIPIEVFRHTRLCHLQEVAILIMVVFSKLTFAALYTTKKCVSVRKGTQ